MPINQNIRFLFFELVFFLSVMIKISNFALMLKEDESTIKQASFRLKKLDKCKKAKIKLFRLT